MGILSDIICKFCISVEALQKLEKLLMAVRDSSAIHISTIKLKVSVRNLFSVAVYDWHGF